MGEYLSPYDVADPVKVRVGYCDGHHWFEAYTANHEKAGLPYVTITRHDWAQWEAHCAACRAWDSYCLAKGNEQYAKERGED